MVPQKGLLRRIFGLSGGKEETNIESHIERKGHAIA
jgi:hypothetical protein